MAGADACLGYLHLEGSELLAKEIFPEYSQKFSGDIYAAALFLGAAQYAALVLLHPLAKLSLPITSE